MLLPVILGIILIADVNCQCPNFGHWKYRNGHCYLLETVFSNYTEAEWGCQRLGAYLVSVTGLLETLFVIEDVFKCYGDVCSIGNPRNHFWIGLSKNDDFANRDDWIWASGDDYRWQHWNGTYPYSEYGYVRMKLNGKWENTGPENKYKYVCEISAYYTASGRPEDSIQVFTTFIEKAVDNERSTEAIHPALNPSEGENDTRKYIYVGASLGVLVLIGVGVLLFIMVRKRSKNESPQPTINPEPGQGIYLSPVNNLANGPSDDVRGVGRQLSGPYEDIENVGEPTCGPYQDLTDVGRPTSGTYEDIEDALQSSSDPYDEVGVVTQPTDVMADVRQPTDHGYLEILPDNEYEDLAPANVPYTTLIDRC